MYKYLAILVTSLILSSCANPLNRVTAQQYYSGGVNNQNIGKWNNAAESFRRAFINTQWGNLSDKEAALYAYEYGRTSGAVCDWSNAKKGLEKAYQLDVKIGTPLHFDLVELALMYQAMGEFEKSKEYFSQTLVNLDKHNALKDQPMYYADTLSRYSEVLNHLGYKTQATDLQKRAEMIIKEKPEMKPHRAIPHGKFCDQKTNENK